MGDEVQRRLKQAVQLLACLLVLSLFIPSLLNAALKLPDLDRGPAIYDFASMVDSSWETKINAQIKEIEAKTTSEIAVVTIESLEGEPLEDYSIRLAEKAGIGKEKTDNGVLLFIAKDEHKIRIETGYGIEGVLPDGECGRIIREIISPQFKQDNFGQGIFDGLSAIGNAIGKDQGASFGTGGQSAGTSGSGNPGEGALGFGLFTGMAACPFCVIFTVVLIIIGVVVWLVIRSRKCPKCGTRMKITTKVLEEATYSSSGRRLVIKDCPKCGYHEEKEETIPMLSDTTDSSSSDSGGGSSGGDFGGGDFGGGGASGDW